VGAHFNRLQPWAPVNSVIVLPLMSLVMFLGFAKILVLPVCPSASGVIGAGLGYLDACLIRVVEALASLPCATVPLPCPPWWVAGTYYLVVVLFVWHFRASDRGRPTSRWSPAHAAIPPPRGLGIAWAAVLVLFVVTAALWQWPREPGRLRVTFLAVGDGAATVIELPDGRTVLYDAGSRSPYDVGRGIVVPFLRRLGVWRVDHVYLSHANLDHFSGVPSVLDEVATGPMIVNSFFESRSPARSASRHLLDVLVERQHALLGVDPPPARWEIGGVIFENLWPPDDLDGAASTNDTSMVLRLTYAGHSMLLTGDIEDQALRGLLAQGNLRADVLALPHHGAVRPPTSAFLEAVAPSVAIRSSGRRAAETYTGLQAVLGGIPVYNTADVGAVEVTMTDDGYRISTFLSKARR
jgi:competence protein ComEC